MAYYLVLGGNPKARLAKLKAYAEKYGKYSTHGGDWRGALAAGYVTGKCGEIGRAHV